MQKNLLSDKSEILHPSNKSIYDDHSKSDRIQFLLLSLLKLHNDQHMNCARKKKKALVVCRFSIHMFPWLMPIYDQSVNHSHTVNCDYVFYYKCNNSQTEEKNLSSQFVNSRDKRLQKQMSVTSSLYSDTTSPIFLWWLWRFHKIIWTKL